MVLVEAAVETIDAAVAAERAGADRIELCERLDLGGTTPARSLVEAVLRHVKIPVHVMVRPRGGGFDYTEDEISLMTKDISLIISLQPSGIVTGVVREDGETHMLHLMRLMRAAQGFPMTFHRAFDSLVRPFEALEELIEAGVKRILTSGSGLSAVAGAPTIRTLVTRARNRIGIIAAGGVRAHNVREVIDCTGVREVHARFVDEDQMRELVAAARDLRQPLTN
jgi:copper homeostasis protein